MDLIINDIRNAIMFKKRKNIKPKYLIVSNQHMMELQDSEEYNNQRSFETGTIFGLRIMEPADRNEIVMDIV